MTFTAAQMSNAFAISNKYIDDNIAILFQMEHPLLEKILANKEYANGESLQFPVNFNKMKNIGSISGTSADVLNSNTQQNASYASLAWKMWYDGFSVTHEELTRGTGDTAVVDILTLKSENAVETFADWLHSQFYGSAVNNPTDINGLGDIFAASGTSYGGLTDTDFGLDVAGDNLWLPVMDSTVHMPSYSNISPFITKLKAKNKKNIDYIITTPAIFQRYKDLNQAAGQRYVGSSDLKSGFDNIMIDGVPLLADAYVPGTGGATTDSYMYGITSKSIGLKYKFGWDKPSPLSDKGINIPNQPVIFRKTLYSGNMYCRDRRSNFCLKTLSPTAAS